MSLTFFDKSFDGGFSVAVWLTWYGRFGWTNASYVYGLSLLSLHAKRALGVQAPYEVYAKALTKAKG